MSELDRIWKGASSVFASRLIQMISQGAISLGLARFFLNPDEYGLLFLTVSIFSVVSLTASLGLPKSTARFISKYRTSNKSQVAPIIRFSLLATIILYVLIFSVFIMAESILVGIIGDDRLSELIPYGSIYVLAHVLYTYQNHLLQGLNKIKESAILTSICFGFQAAFIYIILLLDHGVKGIIVGFVLGYSIGLLYGLITIYPTYINYTNYSNRMPGLRTNLVKYSFPLSLTRSSHILYREVDMILIGILMSSSAVGFYSLAKQISWFVVAPAQSLGFATGPEYADLKSKDNLSSASELFHSSLISIMALYIPAVFGVILTAPLILRHLIGPEYLESGKVLQILSLFIILQALDHIITQALDFLGRARERSIAKGSTAILNFILNLILIPKLGISGAAISTVFCYIIMNIINFYMVTLEFPLKLNYLCKEVFSITIMATSMSLLILFLKSYIDGLVSLIVVVLSAVIYWGFMIYVSKKYKIIDLEMDIR